MVGEDLCFWPTPKTIELSKDLFFWSSLNFGKIGLNWSEDFFLSSPNFVQKIGLNLSEHLFFGLQCKVWNTILIDSLQKIQKAFNKQSQNYMTLNKI